MPLGIAKTTASSQPLPPPSSLVQVNMDEFQSEHPVYTDGLLVFVLQFVTANQWPSNGLFSDYNECDASCEKGSDAPCGCTCLIDPDTMTDDEVG